MRKLELLAPAKNLECGIAAIDHGADAIYIGASRFGARAAAGNSVDDISQLCVYAHLYGVKVYVTINTIIYEEEIDETMNLIAELHNVGVDAFLVQDMAIMKQLGDKEEYSFHASTQTDNRSADKVAWLGSIGFRRVVLARELSLEEISDIHHSVPEMELEAFVHGALCVSYSGVCYASQYCFNRSANRGECAQFCRMKFDLIDSDENVIEHQRHLLSLKDMCQIDSLESLADAGVSSFKIEGRLKDVDYVKNVVSAYSKRLDEIIKNRPNDYCRVSIGNIDYNFEPNLKKTFNRGFTNYFLKGRRPDIVSFDTPKAMGEFVGTVKEIQGNSFNVAGTSTFSNGDGLCFINDNHELEGFRVNRAENNRLFPLKMPQNLHRGMELYRNNDEAFSKLLSGKTAQRNIPLAMTFSADDNGFSLHSEIIATHSEVLAHIDAEHQTANKPQRENIIRQLGKLGNTPYIADRIEITDNANTYFVPSSLLSDLRRKAVDMLQSKHTMSQNDNKWTYHPAQVKYWQKEYSQYQYIYNISNSLSRTFYTERGLNNIVPAYESMSSPLPSTMIMQCRHCIRYSLGYCVKRGGNHPTWHEPLFLRLADGRKFRLQFNCNECQMNIYAEK